MTEKQLKEYCEAEFENIDAVVVELFRVVNAKQVEYSTADLAAIATFIHNFYNGMENILKRILLSKDKEIKQAPTWHKDILKAALKLSIITNELFESLSNYLSFRHYFVHGYSFTLKWEALKPLADNIKKTLEDFKSSIYKELN